MCSVIIVINIYNSIIKLTYFLVSYKDCKKQIKIGKKWEKRLTFSSNCFIGRVSPLFNLSQNRKSQMHSKLNC